MLQVGYMGVPYNGSNMAQHPQYITVRNARGREMLDCLGAQLQRMPAVSKGDSRPLVMQVGLGLCYLLLLLYTVCCQLCHGSSASCHKSWIGTATFKHQLARQFDACYNFASLCWPVSPILLSLCYC
jgi:hypothetical protein